MEMKRFVLFFTCTAIYMHNKYPRKEIALKKSMLNRLTEVAQEGTLISITV